MSPSRRAAVRTSPVIRLLLDLAALAAAVLLGLLTGELATAFGESDGRVIGPLLAPLAISFAFVYFCVLLGFLHRREIGTYFDRFLPPTERALRAIVLLTAVAAMYMTVRFYLFHFLGYWPTDLPSYHYASLALRNGLDPYVPANLVVPEGQRVFPYIYPPFLALIWTPLTFLPLAVVSAIWQVLGLLAIWASLFLCLRLADARSSAARAAALIAGLLVPLGLPWYVAAHHGAISVLFSFLILLFFERLQRGRDRTAGAVLAVACGIKALPVLLLLYLVLKRRWQALTAALITGAGLFLISVLIIGWQLHWEFVTQIAPQVGYAAQSELGFNPVLFASNHSINGFVSRILCPEGTCAAAILLMCLAVAVPVGWFVSRRRAVDGSEAALVAVALLLISPITWLHHMVLIHLPVVVLATLIVDGRWMPRGWWVAVLALAVILAHDSMRLVTAVKHFVPWTDLRFFMLLVVVAALLHIVRRDRMPDATS